MFSFFKNFLGLSNVQLGLRSTDPKGPAASHNGQLPPCLLSDLWGVAFVNSGCQNLNSREVFSLTVMEAGSPRSRCRQGWLLLRLLSSVQTAALPGCPDCVPSFTWAGLLSLRVSKFPPIRFNSLILKLVTFLKALSPNAVTA